MSYLPGRRYPHCVTARRSALVKMEPIVNLVITAAKRTPIGSFMGSLKDHSAVELGTVALKAVLEGLAPEDIADVIVGNVLQAGVGMNPARQIALQSGLPFTVPSQTVNRVCGSGLQAVVSALQALKAGDGELYIAGGVENMSRAPYLVPQARTGNRFGNVQLLDSILSEGLTDPTHQYVMGMTAEHLAQRWAISREDQDAFSVESQQKAAAAIRDGAFADEIVAVPPATSKGTTDFVVDEHPRANSTIESLARLKPAFLPKGGTVTVGNASGLNDGAAMLVVTTERYASQHNLHVLARVLSYGIVGVEPSLMGMGPAGAIPVALNNAGLQLHQVDLFELNEAFAAQSIAVVRDLGLDTAKVNVCGGAIALGHPIGASGTRIVVTLIHSLRRLSKRYGVASLCIGGGMGMALVLSNE
jgi:acetyl-CoA C-acetyltransferase